MVRSDGGGDLQALGELGEEIEGVDACRRRTGDATDEVVGALGSGRRCADGALELALRTVVLGGLVGTPGGVDGADVLDGGGHDGVERQVERALLVAGDAEGPGGTSDLDVGEHGPHLLLDPLQDASRVEHVVAEANDVALLVGATVLRNPDQCVLTGRGGARGHSLYLPCV